MMRGPLFICAILTLVACSEAGFVAPIAPSQPPAVYTPGGPPPPPVIRERFRQVFRWRQASGDLNVAFVVQLHPDHEERFTARLKELTDPNRFILKGRDLPFEKIRLNVVLEKEATMKEAIHRWTTYAPKTQPAGTLEAQSTAHVLHLQNKLGEQRLAPYPSDPFRSLDTVARSFYETPDIHATSLHIVYLRDRDLFFHTEDLQNSRQILTQTLSRFPGTIAQTSVSLLSFQDPNSPCRPENADLGTQLTRHFAELSGAASELCDLPATSMNAVVGTWIQRQGRVILHRTADRNSFEIRVDGTLVPSGDYQYNENSREISFLAGRAPVVGATIEVSYEQPR